MNLPEETIWIWGSTAEKKWRTFTVLSRGVEAKEFPDSGWYILRNGYDVCIITCGPFRFKSTEGHAHNDKLSFELSINRENVFVDPGTYVYTPCPDKRNMFRSTRYHNTVAFANFEQNDLSKGLFGLPETVALKYVKLKRQNGMITFKGKICYKDFLHTRSVTCKIDENYWEIQDTIQAPPDIPFILSYHLAPGLAYKNNSILTSKGQKQLAKFYCSTPEVQVADYEYSPEYGISVSAKKLLLLFNSGCGSQTVYTRILFSILFLITSVL
jgi:hypothetical protein